MDESKSIPISYNYTVHALDLEQAVRRFYPEFRCNWAHDRGAEWYVEMSITGSARDLVRHNLVTQSMIDDLPRCGVRRHVCGVRGSVRLDLFRGKRGYRLEAAYYAEAGQRRGFLELIGLPELATKRPSHLRLVVDNTR